MAPLIWNDWLPPALSGEIRAEEPARWALINLALPSWPLFVRSHAAHLRRSLAFAIRTPIPRCRFGRCITALARIVYADEEFKQQRDRLTPSSISQTLPYVPLVKAFLDAKAEPGLKLIRVLTSTLLAIVLSTECDLTAQARWGSVLHRLLRSHGKKRKKYCLQGGLPFQIEWFPLYTQVRNNVDR